MDLKQLTYFLAIAEAQSFTHAAVRLRITQPALSRQIKELEAELGAPLFERHIHGLSLTDAGKILCERAIGILGAAAAVKDEIAVTLTEPAGDLVVALPAAFRSLITAQLICEYRRRYPKVRMCVLELTTVERQEAVMEGHADLAVTTTMDPEEGLALRPLANEALFIVGPPARQFKVAHAESLESIARLPLVQNTRPNAMRLILETAFSRAGLSSRTAIEVDALDMMTELAVAGSYCFVAPYSSIQHHIETGKISAAPIAGLRITWQIVVSSRRPVSLAVRRFEEMLVSKCKMLIDTHKWETGQFRARS